MRNVFFLLPATGTINFNRIISIKGSRNSVLHLSDSTFLFYLIVHHHYYKQMLTYAAPSRMFELKKYFLKQCGKFNLKLLKTIFFRKLQGYVQCERWGCIYGLEQKKWNINVQIQFIKFCKKSLKKLKNQFWTDF